MLTQLASQRIFDLGFVMLIGILADTHDELARTEQAINALCEAGANAVVHCGDLIGPDILQICARLPMYFVFGNHDSDMVRELENAAVHADVTCLRWGGEITLAQKRIGVAHGHLTSDLKPIIESQPHYVLSGHSHQSHDYYEGSVRRINPGGAASR